MKRQSLKRLKLSLNRETLLDLDRATLRQVEAAAGGGGKQISPVCMTDGKIC